MTWLKFGIATLALSFAASAAGAFEIVDSNNGFAGPAFLLTDPDTSTGATLNSDDFSDAHIYMKGDHEKEFDGYSYSGFVFEDQIVQPSVKVDQSSSLNVSEPAKNDIKH